jgi:rod shape-determining protein MreC
MATRRRKNQGLDPRVHLITLLAFSFGLALLDSHGAFGLLRSVRSVSANVFAPLESAADFAARPVVNFLRDWSEVGTKDEHIQTLTEENSKLRQQLLTVDDLQRQTNQLQHLFQMAGLGGYKIVPARLMSMGSSGSFGATALLDVGSRDGIKLNQTVMAGEGMVGRIVEVTSTTSTALLLIDPTSTIGARVVGSGEIGFLSGTGQPHELRLQFIDATATVKAGDTLVSYGVHGGVYAPGLPLGKVTAVETAQGTNSLIATVDPFIDISSLEIVGVVVTKPRTDPRDSLIPAVQPQPTATVTITALPTTSATMSASTSPTKSGVK